MSRRKIESDIDLPIADISQEPVTDFPREETNDPEPPPRTPPKRRSRAKKNEPPPPPPLTDTEKEQIRNSFAFGFGLVFDIIARRRGVHWELTPEEKQQLGEAWGIALESHMHYVGKAMPIVQACAVTYFVFEPRIARDKLNAAERAEAIEVAENA